MLPYQIHVKHNDPGNWPSYKFIPTSQLLDSVAEESLEPAKWRKQPICKTCNVRKLDNCISERASARQKSI